MPEAYQLHGKTQYSWTTTDGIKNLRLTPDVPKPSHIPSGHVLVRIKAAALNARDMMVLAHDPIYPGPHIDDLVPGADGAGVVEEVGEGSTWKIGDKVVINANSWLDWAYDGSKGEMVNMTGIATKGSGTVHGTMSEYGIFPDAELIKAPAHLCYEELSAIPAAAGTAAHALFFSPRPLRAGQTVLAQGTGGVSCFVIQLASAAGATVIATSSSDAKLEQAKKMGATHTINYKIHPNWDEEVLKVTNGKGVDLVVEVAGASTIEKSLACTKQGGVVALVGFLSESKKVDLTPAVIFGGKTLYGVFNFTREMTAFACEMIGEKGIVPAVGKVFAWEDAPRAFEELGTGSVVGKIVVRVGKDE